MSRRMWVRSDMPFAFRAVSLNEISVTHLSGLVAFNGCSTVNGSQLIWVGEKSTDPRLLDDLSYARHGQRQSGRNKSIGWEGEGRQC